LDLLFTIDPKKHWRCFLYSTINFTASISVLNQPNSKHGKKVSHEFGDEKIEMKKACKKLEKESRKEKNGLCRTLALLVTDSFSAHTRQLHG